MLIVSITVDGRNPAPVDIENMPYFIGFIYNRWLAGFLPTVINTYIGFSIRHSPEPKMTRRVSIQPIFPKEGFNFFFFLWSRWFSYTPRSTNIAIAGKWDPQWRCMYFLLKVGMFQPAMLGQFTRRQYNCHTYRIPIFNRNIPPYLPEFARFCLESRIMMVMLGNTREQSFSNRNVSWTPKIPSFLHDFVEKS